MKKRTSNTTLDQSPDMFQHKWMNLLTRTHIAFPVTIFFAYAVGLLYFANMHTTLSAASITGLFLAGTLLFTFAEYSVHRWGYHPPEDAGPRFKKFSYTVHGIHHDYPKDKQRLALPP
ncbi:MAG: fatty acid hydroxylase, partial [Bacteroidota bacterium]